MRNRTTIVLLGIAIGLTLYYVIFERGRVGPETRLGLLFRFRTSDQVVRLSIAREGETILLEREGDAWRLLEPLAYPAETPRVEDLILRILEFEIKGEFPDAVEGAFPEKGAEVSLTVTFRDGESKRIEVGNPHPSIDVRDRFYRVDGNLVIGDPALADLLRVSVDGLRERIISPVTRDRGVWISVESDAGRTLRFVRTSPGHWVAEAPFRGRADANAVGELIESLNRLSAMDFVDETRDALKKYGLDRPRFRVVVRAQGSDAETRILIGSPIGGEKGAGALMYVTWEERGPVCAVRDVVTEILEKPDDYYRDRHLLDIGADPVARVRIAWPEGSFEVVREGEAWTLLDAGGKTLPTTPELVETFISELQGQEILSFDPPPGETDLAAPALRVEIDFAESGRRIAASIGRPKPPPESRILFAAQVEGEAGVVSVRTDLPNRVREWGRYYVRDRVVARIPFEKIEKLRIRTDDKAWILVRLPNRWVLEGRDEEEGLLDLTKVMDAAGVFVETRAAFMVDPPPTLAAAGLETPRILIRVDCIDDGHYEPPYRELAIGRRPDDRGAFSWAKLDRIDLVFQLATAEIEALLAHLREIGD
ncbi:MAG: DUF4340 domain-containing protein [Planctomycetes bacterium]|nr:DUF4340 domain-containing protein [Planctomycetota bacterium]